MSDSLNSFCDKYLGNKRLFPEIRSKTIGVLIDNGFDCFETVMALDFDEDLPQIIGLNLGQKALVRKALSLLHREYEENYFDSNNDSELNLVFNKIQEKMSLNSSLKSIDKQNTFEAMNRLDVRSDYDMTCDDNCVTDLKTIESSIGSNIENNAINEAIVESNIHNLQNKKNSINSDIIDESLDDNRESEQTLIDWMVIKSSMDEREYERLKQTVRKPWVRIDRSLTIK